MRKRIAFLALTMLALVSSACVPAVSDLVQAPEFRLLAEGSGLQRIDPPGIGRGEAVFRFNFEVTNPNPVSLRFAGLNTDLFIDGSQVLSGTFAQGFSLAANGSSSLSLDVAVPLVEGAGLLVDLAGLLSGRALAYRLDGRLHLDVLGVEQALPTMTVASGTVPAIALRLPEFRFQAEASGVRNLSLSRAELVLVTEVSNPLPLGYLASFPELTLQIAGVELGAGRLISQAVPAYGDSRLELSFELSPLTLGLNAPTVLAALGSGAGLDVALSGGVVLEMPGMGSERFSAQRLLEVFLK